MLLETNSHQDWMRFCWQDFGVPAMFWLLALMVWGKEYGRTALREHWMHRKKNTGKGAAHQKETADPVYYVEIQPHWVILGLILLIIQVHPHPIPAFPGAMGAQVTDLPKDAQWMVEIILKLGQQALTPVLFPLYHSASYHWLTNGMSHFWTQLIWKKAQWIWASRELSPGLIS